MDEKIILLVEDNPDDEELARIALQESNVPNQLVVARDGVEALDYLFATGTQASRGSGLTPWLILLDLSLPKMHGLEVLRHVRADDRTKLLPVVMHTSSTEEKDLHNSYSLGANSYVRKPMDFTQSVETLRQLGQYWLILNEPLPRRPEST